VVLGDGLIDRFASRYTNPKTAHQYRAELCVRQALPSTLTASNLR
jgi:hypothetical protein